MSETRPGVGRAVMLVLFTVLFAAAWRSDHSGRERLVAPLSRAGVPERTASLVALSALSMGETLQSCAAARLVPPDQTNGLTLHSDQGVSAALGRSFSIRAANETGPTLATGCSSILGAQLAGGRRTSDVAETEAIGIPALLSGTWDGLGAVPAPTAIDSVDEIADAAAGAHESVAKGQEATTSVRR